MLARWRRAHPNTIDRPFAHDLATPDHMHAISERGVAMKRSLFGQRFALPSFFPFLMRAIVASNALLVALGAPASGPLQPLPVAVPAGRRNR